MNNNLYMVMGVSGTVVIAIFVFAYLKHKGINTLGVLEKIKTFFTKAETYTDAASNLTTGKAQEILESSKAFEELAIKGTNFAEQMLISLQIENDPDGSKRRELAKNYIYANLKSHKVEITDDIETIVSGMIEDRMLSDKTIEQINAKIDKAINEKINTLQNQLKSTSEAYTKITQENEVLNQRLSGIAAQMPQK